MDTISWDLLLSNHLVKNSFNLIKSMKWLKISKDSYTQFEIFKADDKKCSLIDKTIVIVFTF